MSVKRRLKEFIKHQGMRVSEFELSIGVSNGYVNSISKGIGNDKLAKITELYPKLNIEWLVANNGEMLRKHAIISDAYDKTMRATGYDKTLEVMESLHQYSYDENMEVEDIQLENKILINKIEYLSKENKLLKERIAKLMK